VGKVTEKACAMFLSQHQLKVLHHETNEAHIAYGGSRDEGDVGRGYLDIRLAMAHIAVTIPPPITPTMLSRTIVALEGAHPG